MSSAQFVLALTSEEYNRVGLLAVPNGLEVFYLFSGFPQGVDPWDHSATEVEEHGGNGLRGVSRKKDAGERGQPVSVPVPQAESVTV